MLCEFNSWAQVLILSFAAVGIAAMVILILSLWQSRNDLEGY